MHGYGTAIFRFELNKWKEKKIIVSLQGFLCHRNLDTTLMMKEKKNICSMSELFFLQL